MTEANTGLDYGYANRDGALSLYVNGTEPNTWQSGVFYHPNGIVEVYREAKITRLAFAHAERVFHRTWLRSWGDRSIYRLAREFVADVLSGDLP